MAISYQRKLGDGAVVIDNSTNNVGIGTSDPGVKLHVVGGSTYAALLDSNQDYTLGLARSGTQEWWLKTYTDGRFAIHENGVGDKVTIKAGGNVGIGTTSPDAPLTVHSSTDPEIRFGYSSTQDHRIQWDSSKVYIHADPENANASSALGLYVDGTSRLHILDSGNVGIGTTSPAAKLDVRATSGYAVMIANGDVSSGTNNRVQLRLSYNGTDDYSHFITTRHNSSSSASNAIDFYTSDSTQNGVYPTNAIHGLTIEDGKVGIGTTSPGEKLHVYDTTTNLLAYLQSGDVDAILAMADNGGSVRIQNTNGNLRFLTGGTASTSGSNTSEVMRITSSNVGIGVTSPLAKLDIDGGSGKPLKLTTTNNDAIEFRGASSSPFTFIGYNSRGFRFWDSSNSELFRIASNGDITLPKYGAGYLKTDANGLISVDSDTIEDTLDSVTDRGNTTSNNITVGNLTANGNITTNTGVFYSGNETKLDLNQYNAGYLRLLTDNIERVRVTATGNVGIGTTSPGAKLEVASTGSNGSSGLSDYGFVVTSSPSAQPTLGAESIGDGYANLNLGSDINGTRRFWHISKRRAVDSHKLSFYYYNGTDFSEPFHFETNGVLNVNGADITSTKINNWDTAYGWGNHASAGYGDATQDWVNEQITNLSLGTASQSAATDFVAVSGDTMTSTLEINGNVGTDPILKLYNTSNSNGAIIQFSDQTSQSQTGNITFRHADGQSQGGGASFHFESEPDTVLVVGNTTNKGRFIAWSANNAAEVDYGFADDRDTGMVQTSSNNVSLVAGGVKGVGVGATAVSLKYAGSTKLATTTSGVTVTGEITTTTGSSTSWQTAYDRRIKTYQFDLTGESTSNFYPIVLSGSLHYNQTHFFNFSQTSQSASDPYNNNMIVGWARAAGWSDMESNYRFSYNNYDDSERTVLGIYRTTRTDNNIIIYVRGGETYRLETTSVATIYTEAGSMFNEGTTDANKSVAMILDDTGSDISGQEDASQHISRMVNFLTASEGEYYGKPKINQAFTFSDTLTLSGTSADNSETTALMLDSNNIVRSRNLGSNAFNSTTIPTNNNQLTNGAGYVTGVAWDELGGDQSAIQVSGFNNDAGYLTAHPNITAASSSDNSGRTYIQDITLDSNGHVTGITTATETVVNTNTTYSAGTGLDLSGTTFSVEADLRDGITHVGKDSNNYIQFDSTNGRIDFYAGGVFVARMESDGDLHIKGDVIAFSDIFG